MAAYWYDNNWHYVRRWEHLKKLKSLAKVPQQFLTNCPNYENIDLPQSDRIMGKMISIQIRISWTENELSQRIEKIIDVVRNRNR